MDKERLKAAASAFPAAEVVGLVREAGFTRFEQLPIKSQSYLFSRRASEDYGAVLVQVESGS